jgi:hypothetical protein
MDATTDTRQCDSCYERFPVAEMTELDWGWACPHCAKLGELPADYDDDDDANGGL